MTIEPKFAINNLVKHKFDNLTKGNFKAAIEVLYIHTETCSAGTQIFYLGRHITATKNAKYENNPDQWTVGHDMGQDDKGQALRKYREDELVECPKDIMEIILGGVL